MKIPDSIKGVQPLLRGLMWAAGAGAATAIWQEIYNYFNFADPLDWKGLERAAMAGAFVGITAWFKTHQALWSAPPGMVMVPDPAGKPEAGEAAK